MGMTEENYKGVNPYDLLNNMWHSSLYVIEMARYSFSWQSRFFESQQTLKSKLHCAKNLGLPRKRKYELAMTIWGRSQGGIATLGDCPH